MPARQLKSSLETIFTEELKQPITEEKSSLGQEDIEMVDVYENSSTECPTNSVQQMRDNVIRTPPCILENSEDKIAISIPSVAATSDENMVNYAVI